MARRMRLPVHLHITSQHAWQLLRHIAGLWLAAQVEFSLCHALPARSGLLDACNELGVRWAWVGAWRL